MPVHTIFFSDGTLGDSSCGGDKKPYDHKMYNDLLTLLEDLRGKDVKLFILMDVVLKEI